MFHDSSSFASLQMVIYLNGEKMHGFYPVTKLRAKNNAMDKVSRTLNRNALLKLIEMRTKVNFMKTPLGSNKEVIIYLSGAKHLIY